MKKRSFVWVGVITVVLIAGFAIYRVRAGSSSAEGLPRQTVTLSKTDISGSISVSGVVKSADVTSVYAANNFPVKEIFVSVGDTVSAGDILAALDTSSLDNDIAQAAVNYESSLITAAEDERAYDNSVTNAAVSLESAEIQLKKQQFAAKTAESALNEAKEQTDEPFDSYSYDLSIEDALINLERKAGALDEAKYDLDKAQNSFDGYVYQNNITEAKIALDRRKADLAEAKANLDDEKTKLPGTFDAYAYENAITDAQKILDRKWDDYYTAIDENAAAYADYSVIMSNPKAENEAVSSAWARVESTQKAMDNALRAVTDAQASLERANTDKTRATDDYNEKNADSKENSLSAAEKAYNNALNAVSDAERALNKAVTDMDRAKKDTVTNASNNYTNAQNAVNDAKRAYEKALNDKQRAIDDHIDSSRAKLESAQKTYDESVIALQSAENSLKAAKNSLSQAKSKPGGANANVKLRELGLEKLTEQANDGVIKAAANGVITEINAKVGANPNGVMFIIENVENLYVQANIKEYNLSSVKIGQNAIVTTDAGDTAYNAAVSYISPKAVSEAGSTSVEFEVRTAIDSPDDIIKIGMNAFLNIITDVKTDVYAVPISAIITDERGSFVYAYEDGGEREIPVSIGLKTSTEAEIEGAGLSAGLELLLDPAGALTQPGQGVPGMPFRGGAL